MATKKQLNIDFVGKVGLFGGISLAMVVGFCIYMAVFGLNYGIDFSGGTEVQIRFGQPVSVDKLREFTESLGFKGGAQVQQFGTENEFLVRFENPPATTEKEANEILTLMIQKVTEGIKKDFGAQTPEIRRVDSVGPQVGKQLKRNSVLAAFYCLLFILIYVAMRFDYKYAPGAVICLFHDAIVTLGFLALLRVEINGQIVAAILTLIGYSLNDTIVMFDRIRENVPLMKDKKISFIINRSINDVVVRSLLTGFTVLLANLALFFFAGGVIRDFALTLLIGIIFGAYSSIYIASPLIIVWDRWQGKSV